MDSTDSLDFVTDRTCQNERTRLLFELFERHRTDVAFGSFTDGDLSFFHLAVARDEHERYLLHLCVAYLRADFLAAQIRLDAQAGSAKLFCHRLRVIIDAIRNRQDDRLHRSEPKGKRAGVMLNQDAEEAFD